MALTRIFCNEGEGGEVIFGEDEVQDDAIFLGHSFLQKLQVYFCFFLLFSFFFTVQCTDFFRTRLKSLRSLVMHFFTATYHLLM